MEDGQLDLAPVTHIGDELVVPGRAVGLLLGGRLADARIVHVEGDVGVEKESLRPGSHRMAQRPGCGLQAHGLADFDLKKAIEHYHGRGEEWGPGSLRPPRGQERRTDAAALRARGLLGPLSPHRTLSLHLVALRPGAGDSQPVHVFPRRVPNGKQGGGGELGDVRVWSKSLPPTPTAAPPEEEMRCWLRCKPRGLCRRLAASLGPGCGEAGSAPGAYLPFRNIIPEKFRLREGEGAVRRGGDENRGCRFQPGSSSHTQRLPLTARGGGMDQGMCSLSGGMHVERKWSSSEPNF